MLKDPLTKEKLCDGIDDLCEELNESLASFAKARDGKSLREIKEISSGILHLKDVCCTLYDDDEYDRYDKEYDVRMSIHSEDDKPRSKHAEKREYSKDFTKADAEDWVEHMETELPDGDIVKGAHWSMDQTNVVAKKVGIRWEHITPYCFWVTMNMMYSDYLKVASAMGIDTPEFYCEMAKAFLFDVDSVPPKEKLKEYYEHIVKPAMVD